MADILVQLRQEDDLNTLENGVTGLGGLEERELGYATDEQLFSMPLAGGGRARIPSLGRLILADTAENAGAALIGYAPGSGGFAATNLQDAIDELRAALGGLGGGGIIGPGTAGNLPIYTAANTIGNSVLSQASSKLLFSGDAVANLYRSAPAQLSTDGAFLAEGGLFTNGAADLASKVMLAQDYLFDNSKPNYDFAVSISTTLTKNNANTREFSVLNIMAYIEAGASNSATHLNMIEVDTLNIDTTGVVTDLMVLKYGGVRRARLDSQGDFFLTGNAFIGLFGVGDYGDANAESLVVRHMGASGAVINVAASGTGVFRDLSFGLGGVSRHLMAADGGVGLGWVGARVGSLHLGPDASGVCAIALEASAAPTLTAKPVIYQRGNKIVFGRLDGATTKYWTLDLTASADQSLVYTTTAP